MSLARSDVVGHRIKAVLAGPWQHGEEASGCEAFVRLDSDAVFRLGGDDEPLIDLAGTEVEAGLTVFSGFDCVDSEVIDVVAIAYEGSVALRLRHPQRQGEWVLMVGMVPPTFYGPVLISVGNGVSASDLQPYQWLPIRDVT